MLRQSVKLIIIDSTGSTRCKRRNVSILTIHVVGILLLNMLEQLFDSQMRWQNVTVCSQNVYQLFVNEVIISIERWYMRVIVDVSNWWVDMMETFFVMILIQVIIFVIVFMVGW